MKAIKNKAKKAAGLHQRPPQEMLKKNGDGKNSAVIGISERREIEKKLIESEKKYRSLIANSLVGVFTTTLKGEIIYVNDAMLRMFEYDNLEELLKSSVPSRYKNSGDREVFIEAIKENGRVDSYELELLTRTGKIKNVLISATLDGDILSGMLMDITERKKMEETLQKSKEELELRVRERTAELLRANETISASNDLLQLFTRSFSRNDYLDSVVDLVRVWSRCRCVGVRILDENGNIPYESYVGFSKKFWEQENFLSVNSDRCACTRVMTGKFERCDAPFVTTAGSFFCNNSRELMRSPEGSGKKCFRGVCAQNGFASIAVVPLRYQNKVLGAFHLADKKEGKVSRKNIEFIEAIAPIIGEVIHRFSIEEDRTRLMAAAQSAPDAIIITDVKGKIQYANPALERITGYSLEEAAGHDLHILDSGRHDEAFYQVIRESMKQGKIWNGLLISKKKDGTLYHEDCTISPTKDASGKIINYVSVRRDITDKLRLESIAEAVNAMNNIGYIFSGIRHEIGNPINSIKMALTVLQSNLNNYSKEAVLSYIQRIQEELSRVEYLLKNLKTFNMYEIPALQDMRMTDFLGKFLSLFKNDYERKGIAITCSVDPDAELCHADPRALQQVLLNISTNAIDACEGRPNPKISITVSKISGMIRLRFSDSGCGITGEHLGNLFKPFYTTKSNGTGLGLVIAKKMLAKMNSSIEVKSRINEGTEVDIFVPEVLSEQQ
ncbi:MAG: PAS domain S-box protein [Nitrospirae bacterium]|nr:PAS domain S-box protein [Nitrospirota bacterium]